MNPSTQDEIRIALKEASREDIQHGAPGRGVEILSPAAASRPSNRSNS